MDDNHEPVSAPLLECTIRNLRELLRRLEDDKAELDRKLTDLRRNIGRLEAQLGNSPASIPRDRNRRGENLQRIRQLFAADPEIALSMQQIAEKTTIPLSSVQAVLRRPDCGVRKDEFSGLYRLERAEPAEKPQEEPLRA